MYNNFKDLVNLKNTIFKNKKLIILIQLISIIFAIIYFYNAVTNYTYSTRYQNPYSEIISNGRFWKKTNDLEFNPRMNFFKLDYYYNFIFGENFDLPDKCRVSGYNNKTVFSTKNETGFSFDFSFRIKPLMTINYRSNDKIKAKECVEAYVKNLIEIDNFYLKKLRIIEENKINKFNDLEIKMLEAVLLEINKTANLKKKTINDKKKLSDELSVLVKEYDLFTNLITEISSLKIISYYDPIILSSEYKEESSTKIFFITLMFIFFGLFVSAIIIMIKDYKL